MNSNSLKTRGVVIVGGGFGGLTTALALSSRRVRPPIILIEPRKRFVFQPLLYELLSGELEAGAPGVYMGGRKIASLGLRLKNGCSYHGVALNVSNDLEPFSRINPCGVPNQTVTRLSDHVTDIETADVRDALGRNLLESIYGDQYSAVC